MFIVNIEQFQSQSNLFKCDKYKAKELQKKGFSVLGIKDGIYYFYETDALINYLSFDGGDKNEQHPQI